jgi:hypothetical protein
VRPLYRQRSLQAKNGLLVMSGFDECFAEAEQRSKNALALETGVLFREM